MMSWSEHDLNIYRKYLRFLKENNIMYRVICLLENTHDRDIINHHYKNYEAFFFKRILNDNDILTIFAYSSAFCSWSNTSEGRSFWLDINKKWVQYCIIENLCE